ncbi:hypothetical protein QTN25_007186 [Entamoeba marina]
MSVEPSQETNENLLKKQILDYYGLNGELLIHESLQNRPLESLKNQLFKNFYFDEIKFPNTVDFDLQKKSNIIYSSNTNPKRISTFLSINEMKKSKLMIICKGTDLYELILSPLYYFEVELIENLDKPVNSSSQSLIFDSSDDQSTSIPTMSIGLNQHYKFGDDKMLGHSSGSYALHSEDGNYFRGSGKHSKQITRPSKYGNTLGCGYCPSTNTIFFTRNGDKLEDEEVTTTPLYFGMSINVIDSFSINFGKDPFVFNLYEEVLKRKN